MNHRTWILLLATYWSQTELKVHWRTVQKYPKWKKPNRTPKPFKKPPPIFQNLKKILQIVPACKTEKFDKKISPERDPTRRRSRSLPSLTGAWRRVTGVVPAGKLHPDSPSYSEPSPSLRSSIQDDVLGQISKKSVSVTVHSSLKFRYCSASELTIPVAKK